MKKILLKFLTIESIESDPINLEHASRVATAVLLVEVTRADFIVQPSEKMRLRQLLERQFSLSTAELDALMDEAEADADRLVSTQHITRLLNEHYDHAMKLRVVEMMWQLVYADGNNRAVIIHTATGDHLRDLQHLFDGLIRHPSDQPP